jgi:hypothetical protein
MGSVTATTNRKVAAMRLGLASDSAKESASEVAA